VNNGFNARFDLRTRSQCAMEHVGKR